MPDLYTTKAGWYCFKALPKKEHIAANFLNRTEGIESFCPRISFFKKTKRGKVRFIESLFPGYVFIHADLHVSYRIIRSTQGIRDVVSFGSRVPMLQDEFIDELKSKIGDNATKDLPDPVIKAGQDVIISSGPFKDLQAVVTGELDGQQRVALLMSFLGREMQISIHVDDISIENREPKTEVWKDQ